MSEYHLDLWLWWLNSVLMRTLTGSRWTSSNYITRCHRRLEVVSSRQWVPLAVGDRMPAEWEPAPDRGLEPSVTPSWAAQPECERSVAMVRGTWGSIWGSLSPSPTHLSHITDINPFENKVWEVYFFIKKCVRSFIEVVNIVSAYICMYMSIQQFCIIFLFFFWF